MTAYTPYFSLTYSEPLTFSDMTVVVKKPVPPSIPWKRQETSEDNLLGEGILGIEDSFEYRMLPDCTNFHHKGLKTFKIEKGKKQGCKKINFNGEKLRNEDHHQPKANFDNFQVYPSVNQSKEARNSDFNTWNEPIRNKSGPMGDKHLRWGLESAETGTGEIGAQTDSATEIPEEATSVANCNVCIIGDNKL